MSNFISWSFKYINKTDSRFKCTLTDLDKYLDVLKSYDLNP